MFTGHTVLPGESNNNFNEDLAKNTQPNCLKINFLKMVFSNSWYSFNFSQKICRLHKYLFIFQFRMKNVCHVKTYHPVYLSQKDVM